MSRRSWVAVCAVAAVAAAAAVVLPRTGWLTSRAHHRAVPTCAETFNWPTVQHAVETAFATLREQRERRYADVGDGALCYIDATALYIGAERPEAGTPRTRTLTAQWFPEEVRSFRLRRGECQPAANATGLADEPGLGEDAFSCWTTFDVLPYHYLARHLHVRVGDISVLIELIGANYGPQSDGDDRLALRSEVEQHTRCIAEELTLYFDGRVSRRHPCGGTAQAM